MLGLRLNWHKRYITLGPVATLLGLVPPFVGPIVYLFLRPADSIDERRDRELENRALEERLAASGIRTTFGKTSFDPSGRILIEHARVRLPAN